MYRISVAVLHSFLCNIWLRSELLRMAFKATLFADGKVYE